MANPEHIIQPENYPHKTTLGEYVREVCSDATGNESYLVSRNRILEGPLFALTESLQDLPPFIQPDLRGRVSLWLGPQGTQTPLHHDTTNVLFCQIYGRKRITLISNRQPALLEAPIDYSFYSRAAAAAQTMYQVDIEPGQALFIPVGWWHAVESLSTSVSIGFTGFCWPNRFDWYRPGDW